MALDPVLRAAVTICILVFSAKVLGEIFSWRHIPSVLGELTAGILLGPYALGSLIVVNGAPVIELNEIVLAFGEIGGILILFSAGLDMTFADFRKVGRASFTVGALGVIVPFIMGYGASLLLGFGQIASLVIGAALVATSISITELVLREMNKTKRVEARMMICAAVVDDVLGLAILGVIVSFIATSAPITPTSVVMVMLGSLVTWLLITGFSAMILPRIVDFTSGGSEGVVEATATASCFAASALAAYFGLSPIVGAFAAGMAVASSKMIETIKDYTKKMSIIFSPVFFALAGAAFNLGSFFTSDWFFYAFFIILVVVAVISKMVGCGLPAAFFLKNRSKGLKVGYGMISRGEVGLIVAGVAITSGAITQSTYAAIMGMVMITTVIAPLLLRNAYSRGKFATFWTGYEDEEDEEETTPDQTPTYPL